jgi:hypothetical protein
MTTENNPAPCHYCGNPNVEYVEVQPEYEWSHGPGLFSRFHIACPDCGLRGGSVSRLDIPSPRVTRKYKVKTFMGTFPVEDYAPQDTDAEVKRAAIAKWNAMPPRYK